MEINGYNSYSNNVQWQTYTASQTQEIFKGQSGSTGQNLKELQEVQDKLRRRNKSRKQQPPAFAIIDDQNTTRLFKPSLPMNQYVHPDDHLAWLRGRTITVCRKSAWARTTS